MVDAGSWLALIVGLILGIILYVGASQEDLMRTNAWRSYRVYDDEDDFMDDLEGWILVEDLEEELEDDGYFDDEG